MSLNPKQLRFVDEYLIDLNGTQAAIRAGYSAKTANEQGARLLANVSISAIIKARQQERSERTEITQDMVLNRFWKIATADPRKLIEYRREACRYCYGLNHAYQWIDEAEYIEYAMHHGDMDANDPGFRDSSGGYGFNPTITPHAKCPKCFGRGTGEVAPHDTRNLDEESALLYAGVKVTKDGLEIKMHDQLKALENVARHLGMFTDKQEVKHSGEVASTHKLDTENLTTDQLRAIANIRLKT
jgi:phage terminase small subunit